MQPFLEALPFGTPIAWYKAQLPGFPRKSIREGASIRNARVFIFWRVCSQFLEGLFAILFEVLLIEIQEEIHHFAGWEGGGLSGANFVN